MDQTRIPALPDITALDYLAFAFYAASWAGYTYLADHSSWRRRSIMKLMDDYREQWMLQMRNRDVRIMDASIIGSLQNGAAFLASTTILVLGGLIAALGASDEVIAILATLPLVEVSTVETWQIKMVLLIGVMAYAFSKFVWTFRLQNYCSILLGATPNETDAGSESKAIALRAAWTISQAARHFNRGLRAYFFTLAALAWFLHPVLFMAVTACVVYVLYRREFRSKSLKALRGGYDER